MLAANMQPSPIPGLWISRSAYPEHLQEQSAQVSASLTTWVWSWQALCGPWRWEGGCLGMDSKALDSQNSPWKGYTLRRM